MRGARETTTCLEILTVSSPCHEHGTWHIHALTRAHGPSTRADGQMMSNVVQNGLTVPIGSPKEGGDLKASPSCAC